MLISILVPIYNVEKYIERCLQTIFHQTYSDLEFIFVDDCSPDKSVLLLENYINANNIDRDRVKIVHHNENKGIAITRRHLLDNAQGIYVLFIDSDDWIEKDMVEQMINKSNNGTIDIIGCDFTKEYKDGKCTFHYETYANNCYDNIIKTINYTIGPTLWKVLVKRELFNHITFLPNIEIGEDYLASIQLYYYAQTCSSVHKYLYHYVQYNNYRYSNQIEKSISNHIQAVNTAETFLKNKSLYNEAIRHEFNLRKFAIKSYYLIPPLLNYTKWKETFPESNRMWRYINYSPKEKFKFWLAEKKSFRIFIILKRLESLICIFCKNF